MKNKVLMQGLLKKANSNFRIQIATEVGRPPLYRDGGGLPLMSWPDYTVCFEANCWVEDFRVTRISPGSICEYCYQITPLLRYAFNNQLSLRDFDEYHFVRFMTKVKQAGRQPKLTNSFKKRVEVIGTKSLEFLVFVGDLYSISDYVSKDGKIKGFKSLVKVNRPGGMIEIEVWQHSAIPKIYKSQTTNSTPLSQDSVKRLKSFARKIGSKPYFKSRNRMLIQLFEETGGRRSEICALTVGAVREAAAKLVPSILVNTVKKRAIAERLIEISPVLITLLEDYIEHDLIPFLQFKHHKITSSTPLFLSAKTLTAIQPKTATSIFRQLKISANIAGPVHPHQFRHLSIQYDEKKNKQDNPTDEILSRLIGRRGTPEYVLMSMEKHGHASPQSRIPYLRSEPSQDLSDALAKLDPKISSALRATAEAAQELVKKRDKLTIKENSRLEKLLDALCDALDFQQLDEKS